MVKKNVKEEKDKGDKKPRPQKAQKGPRELIIITDGASWQIKKSQLSLLEIKEICREILSIPMQKPNR